MDNNVKLIESFQSWQGEGVDSGRRMIILRFKYCNRKCNFCDTLVKMRTSQEGECSISSLQETITDEKLGLLITGGEPTIVRHMSDCIKLLNQLDYPIANVETNGFNLVELIEEVNPTKPVHYMFSPKLFSDDDVQEAIKITKNIGLLSSVFIKVVYEPTQFVNDYLEFTVKNMNLNQKVSLMPEGNTKEKIFEHMARTLDAAEHHQVCLSNRDHILFNFI